MRTTTTYAATIDLTEPQTTPPCWRYEVWMQEGETYRSLADQHLRLSVDEINARRLPTGWGRLVVHRGA